MWGPRPVEPIPGKGMMLLNNGSLTDADADADAVSKSSPDERNAGHERHTILKMIFVITHPPLYKYLIQYLNDKLLLQIWSYVLHFVQYFLGSWYSIL